MGAIERAVTAREIALLHALKSNIWPSVSPSSCLLGQGTFGLQTAVSLDHQNAVGERPSSSRPGYQSISAGPSKGPARAGRLVAPAGVIWPHIPVRCNHPTGGGTMARRNTPPKPAEPKPANRQRHQRKPDSESVTSVKYRKTEKDVAKLIDCLAEWTRDLQAARSAAPEVSPPWHSLTFRGPKRCFHRITGAVLPTGKSPHRIDGIHGPGQRSLVGVHRGRFHDLQGGSWRSRSTLPDRHLRFDSASESRFTSHLPAGSPFLAEARLQCLLDEAQPDPPLSMTTGSPGASPFRPGRSDDRVVHRARRGGT